MFRNIKLISMFAALILSLAVIGSAQDRFGEVEGIVKDTTGAVIPNATVTIQGNSFNRTVQTNDSGFFRILAVPPGSYKVSASANGFASSNETNATVTLGESTPVNFSLQVAGAAAEVTVTGDVAAIDTTSSRVQDNITEKRFEEIPKGTNFTSVLQTTPGVQEESKGAGVQIDGSSGAENTFIVDGQEVTNFRTGQLNSNNNLPFSLIQEVQIKKGGFEAEHGGATGGVITLVTKRGGNEFSGDLTTSFRTSALDSANAFVDPTNVTTLSNTENRNIQQSTVLNPSPSALTYFRAGEDFAGDDYVFFFPSASLSGPIIKDRLWFFGAYNVQSFTTERTVNHTDGNTENYRRNERRDYGFFRLDSQFGNLNLTGSYTYNPIRVHGDLAPITPLAGSTPSDGVSSGAEFLNNSGGRRSSTTYNFGGTWANNNWILSARFGESALDERLGSYGIPTGIERVRCITGNGGLPGTTPAGTCAAGFSNVPTVFATTKDISKRRTFDVDASALFEAGGRHNVKFGYQLNQLSNDVDQGYVNTGEIRFFYGRSSRGFGTVDGGIGYVYLQNFGALGNTSSKNQAVYIQDSWTIGRLTLNPGFRIEREDVPSFSDVGVPIIFGWGDKPAPRIGAAFDVLGNGKWKVYGGYGWFYDRFKYELPRGSFGGNTFTRHYMTILASNPDFNDPIYNKAGIIASATASQNGGMPAIFDFRVPSNDPNDNRVDPNLKAARQSAIDLGTEYEFANSLVFGARFVHKQVDTAIEDVGIFDANGNENFFIANPGFGVVAQPFFPGFAATPKAERKYDAIEVSLNKRFSNNWFANGSYTYSRLFGNYSGLASSDENGRSSPNVNRMFDLPFLGFDADGNPDNGRLATDRPHIFKLNAGYNKVWSGSNTTEFKGFFIGQSGTPISTRVSFYGANTFLNGRGDLGRTEAFTQTDFAVTHKYRFGRDNAYTLAFDVDVLNMLNERNVTNRQGVVFGSDLSDADVNFLLPNVTDELTFIGQIFNGGLASQIRDLNQRGDAGLSTCVDGASSCAAYVTDARYNQPSQFQIPRSVRFGFRFIF